MKKPLDPIYTKLEESSKLYEETVYRLIKTLEAIYKIELEPKRKGR